MGLPAPGGASRGRREGLPRPQGLLPALFPSPGSHLLPSAGQLVPLLAFCPLRGCSLFPEGSRVLGEGEALAAPAINCQLLLCAGGACAGASTGFQLHL